MRYVIKTILILMVSLPLFVACETTCEAHNKNASIYIPMLQEYIQKDASLLDVVKDAHMFTLEQWLRISKNGNS